MSVHVPMLPTLAISKRRFDCRAYLMPDYENRRYDIEIRMGVPKQEIALAEREGTVQDGYLVHTLDGKTWRTPIKTLRGDYRRPDGGTGNRMRRWEKHDFSPRPDDIFQERLYAIHWFRKETLNKSRQETFFASVTEADLKRERKVERIMAENLACWQEEGLVPDMEIEPGDKTDEPIRTRGWTYWHHLFHPRHLLLNALCNRHSRKSAVSFTLFPSVLNRSARLTRWDPARESAKDVFQNQALNTFWNNPARAWKYAEELIAPPAAATVYGRGTIENRNARQVASKCNIWLTDPQGKFALYK